MLGGSIRDCPPNCRFHLKTIIQSRPRHSSKNTLENSAKRTNSHRSKDVKLPCTRCSSARALSSQRQSTRRKSPTQFSTNAQVKKQITPFYMERQSPIIMVKTVADTPQEAIEQANDKMQQLDRVIEEMRQTAMMMKLGMQPRNYSTTARTQDKQIQCNILSRPLEQALFPINNENLEQHFSRKGQLNYRIQRSNKIYQNIRRMQLQKHTVESRRPSLF